MTQFYTFNKLPNAEHQWSSCVERLLKGGGWKPVSQKKNNVNFNQETCISTP